MLLAIIAGIITRKNKRLKGIKAIESPLKIKPIPKVGSILSSKKCIVPDETLIAPSSISV